MNIEKRPKKTYHLISLYTPQNMNMTNSDVGYRYKLLVKNAKKKSKDLIEESIKIIEPFGEKAKNLIDLANFIISRNK